MARTPSEISTTIKWLRELHWDLLRVSKQYRLDLDLLSLQLRKARVPWDEINSSDDWAQRRDAIAALNSLDKLRAFGIFCRLASSGNIRLGNRLTPLFSRQLKSDDQATRCSVLMELVFEGRRASSSLDMVSKFCEKWQIRFPLPVEILKLPWDADLFTGPFAQPIRQLDIDGKSQRLTMRIFTGVGKEIATEFALGALGHFLPKERHWTMPLRLTAEDWKRLIEKATTNEELIGLDKSVFPTISVKFQSTKHLERLLEKHGAFGNVVSTKTASGYVAVKRNKDEALIDIRLPIDKKILRSEMKARFPKAPLKLKQDRSWTKVFEAQRLHLEGRTWPEIGCLIFPNRGENEQGDPKDWARALDRRYKRLLLRFFPHYSRTLQ